MPSPYSPPPRRSFFKGLIIMFGVIGMLIVGVFVAGIGLMFLVHLFGGGEGGGGLSLGHRIGLVRIEGTIMPGPDTDFWLETLRDFGKSKSIKGVVVRINSPGGSVGASQELQSMILRMRRDYGKPVYVSMGDMAASGGYYIAAGADQIYSLKGTLTGSIGVLMSKPDLSQLAEKLGVGFENVKTGRFKDSGEMTRKLSTEEQEMLSKLIMNTYDQFLDDILLERAERITKASQAMSDGTWASYKFENALSHEPRAFLRSIADGRAYTGQQALELGLVDHIGTLDDTILALGEKLNIHGWPEIQQATRKPSLRELLGSKLSLILPTAQSPLQYRMDFP